MSGRYVSASSREIKTTIDMKFKEAKNYFINEKKKIEDLKDQIDELKFKVDNGERAKSDDENRDKSDNGERVESDDKRDKSDNGERAKSDNGERAKSDNGERAKSDDGNRDKSDNGERAKSDDGNRDKSGYNRDKSGYNRDKSGYNRDKSGYNRDNDLIKLKELESDYKHLYDKFTSEEIKYYSNVSDIIIDYYNIRDNTASNNTEKDIMFFFNQDNENNNKKNSLLETYYKRIEGTAIHKDNGSNRIKYCQDCQIEKILDLSESCFICPICGLTEGVILDDERKIKDYSPYKRLNHFKEWINQFQAKEIPDIPEQVYSDIIQEFKKNRIYDLSKINKKSTKIILKKIGYNIYYEHITYIINKLNNLPPPRITKDMEKIFISMFHKIQEPWERHKPSNRKNFMLYSYTLYKFCELLELDNLLECFPLHKNMDKVMENDAIWMKICKDLNWQYISSFK
jgi:hypothetical protein